MKNNNYSTKKLENYNWEKHFQTKSNSNNLFYKWFDEMRLLHFGKSSSKKSLEIGPGLGNFARIAQIKVVVDCCKSALDKMEVDHEFMKIETDASNLPFEDNYFNAIYTNDVMHHLKAQGKLSAACNEIKRVLASDGYWFISDRLPIWQNSILLKISNFARKLFLTALKLIRKEVILSGSDKELPMNDSDYETIKEDMVLEKEKKWKTMIVFWLYGLYLFSSLIIPKSLLNKLENFFIRCCEWGKKFSQNLLKPMSASY